MMLLEMLVNGTFIAMLGHTFTQFLRCQTNVVDIAMPTGIVRTFKVVNHIGLTVMCWFWCRAVPHK